MVQLQYPTMRPSWWYLLSVGIVYRIVTDTCTATVRTASVYARRGGPVTVTWAMSPIKEFIVKKGYRVLFQITGNNKVTITDRELRTRINVNTVSYTRGTFSFHLHNVTSSDAGQYSCYVDSSHHGRTQIKHCGQTLYVVDLHDPHIITEQELSSNITLKLTCLCNLWIYPESSPSVSVVWKENDDRLYSGQRNHILSSDMWIPVYDGRKINYTSILTIRDGWQQNDTYKCRVGVQNVQSEWSEEIYPLYWSDDNTNFTVVPEGDDAMMTWRMPSLDSESYITSPSGPYLMWKLSDRWNVGDTYISRLEIRGTRPSSESAIVRILLHNVTGRDAGKYLCTSGNHLVPKCGHTLIVSRKPVKPTIFATHQYQSVSLTCSSTSRSLPQDHNLTMTYSWRRDNTRLVGGGKYQISGSTLTIFDAREKDNGYYSCQSTEIDEQASEWSMQFQLNVEPRRNDTITGTHMTLPALGTIIGCSIAAISLLVAAVVILVRQKDARDYIHRFQSCLTPTENTDISLQDLTDPDYDVIDETCTVLSETAEGQKVDRTNCSLSQTPRSVTLNLELLLNKTHRTGDSVHAEAELPEHSDIAVHQRGMAQGCPEDGRLSANECGVVVQKLESARRDKGGKGGTISPGPGWVTSPVDAHSGTVLRIMSDLDNIIAETMTILNQIEGKHTSTVRYQRREC
ncbi:uncharacterized protein [Haliotis asinina]|uniref:uncharacterized protein n=1 Tax=Haliotis asinina TaxID=109174 RepID=UPI0035321306